MQAENRERLSQYLVALTGVDVWLGMSCRGCGSVNGVWRGDDEGGAECEAEAWERLTAFP